MAALLVGMSVMAVMLSVALPLWRTAAKREREAELIFRGEQYARAVALFQRKYANTFPPNLEILIEQKFLRKQYMDPMTKDGEFQLLYVGDPTGAAGRQGGPPAQAGQSGRGGAPAGQAAGQIGRAGQAGPPTALGATPTGARGGITGVASKSTEVGLRLYNGLSKYNEWAFVAIQADTQAGGGADGAQGVAGRGGRGGRGQQPAGRGGRGAGAGPTPGPAAGRSLFPPASPQPPR
jgi:hypothetical protein